LIENWFLLGRARAHARMFLRALARARIEKID